MPSITRRAGPCTLAARGPESCSRRSSRPQALLSPAPPRSPVRTPAAGWRPQARHFPAPFREHPFKLERCSLRRKVTVAWFDFADMVLGGYTNGQSAQTAGLAQVPATSVCSCLCAIARRCGTSIARKLLQALSEARTSQPSDGHRHGRERSQHDVWRGGRKLLGGIASCPAFAIR
jgi:hypothetical protein